MPINTPYLAHQAGFPGQWSDSINPSHEGLIVGETPTTATRDMELAADTTFLLYQPVGYAAGDSGPLVPATDAIQAIGITLYPIVTGALPAVGVPILYSACLNMDMLAWPASIDTEAEKLRFFDGAPSPSQITVKKAYLGATVAQP